MIKSAKENNFTSYDYKAKTQLPLPRDEYKFTKSTSASLLSSRSLKSTNDLDDVKSPYNSLTHKVRKIMPHEIACKLGCKGKKCKYCNSTNWTDDEMAIPGIFSHWITDDILAMARPRDELIRESNLIHKMKKAGIRSIFNLQTRYEHKDCGEGVLKDTGFSYDPNDFTSNGIYYYNFELEDYSIGSIHRMLDMVKVFDFSLSEGRVAVHCHAGLGRTGLLISCYLIYLYRMNAKEAINFVREKRPNSVQMNDQIQAVKDFENYLKPLRVVYFEPNDYIIDSLNLESGASNTRSNSASFSLNTFLHRQRYILHGYERKQLKYIPKILFVCGEQLRKLANRWKIDGKLPRHLRDIKRISSEFDRDFSATTKSSSNNNRARNELDPLQFIAEALATVQFSRKVMRKVEYYQNLVNDSNQGYDVLSNDEDPFVLSAMIWSWLDQLKEPVLRDQEINILLKGYSHKSSNFDYVNWKDLDKGTLQTVNYLIGILNELIPLEEELKNDLISHLIACLTQTNIRYDNKEFNEENDDEFDSIQVLKPTKKLKKYNFLILKSLIKELVDKPNKFYDKNLNKSLSFKKEVTQYDYEEEVFENSYSKNNKKNNNDDSDYRPKNHSRYNDY